MQPIRWETSMCVTTWLDEKLQKEKVQMFSEVEKGSTFIYPTNIPTDYSI